MNGVRKARAGAGATLHTLALALRESGLPEEPVRGKLALGAEWDWRTDLDLTGEPLTRADLDAITVCQAVAP